MDQPINLQFDQMDVALFIVEDRLKALELLIRVGQGSDDLTDAAMRIIGQAQKYLHIAAEQHAQSVTHCASG